ncbi:MAG: peptidoglycan recognition family protein [bacterium]
MGYEIKTKLLTKGTKRRSGLLIEKVRFIVAHDTANPNSTARNNVSYYERTNNQSYASAHIFVDDKEIIECIPSITSDKPEKAWQVRYELVVDNILFGGNANDQAIGVELCFGSKIDSREAYLRYVWVLAKLCKKYSLDPSRAIVGHSRLDPGRKIDPENALLLSGKTFADLLIDVAVVISQNG